LLKAVLSLELALLVLVWGFYPSQSYRQRKHQQQQATTTLLEALPAVRSQNWLLSLAEVKTRLQCL
jgi:hypothetical protein